MFEDNNNNNNNVDNLYDVISRNNQFKGAIQNSTIVTSQNTVMYNQMN